MDNLNPATTTVLSLDEIRSEIGLPGEKPYGNRIENKQAYDIFKQRFSDAVKRRDTIILNTTGWHHALRQMRVADALRARYNILYHIVEGPSIQEIKSRRTILNPDVIDNMIEKFEFPTLKECHLMIIHKQYFDDNHNVVTVDYPVFKYMMNHYAAT